MADFLEILTNCTRHTFLIPNAESLRGIGRIAQLHYAAFTTHSTLQIKAHTTN
jgi:hypothetical protein